MPVVLDHLLAAAASPAVPGVDAGTDPAALRRALHLQGAAAFRDRVRLAWAASPDVVGWRAVHDLPDRWRPPPFPLTGADIAAAGVAQGPGHGRMRRALELWWAQGDFSADREAALAELRRLAAASGGMT